MEVEFTINNQVYSLNSSNIPFDTTLNTFIRDHAHLRGTKFMCLEGGCGVCIVTVHGIHPATNEYETWSINSCLTSIFSCHGLEITTVEGVGNKKIGYDTIQRRLVQFNGIQCGYCTPGFVMNMYSLLQSKNGTITMDEVENSFGGNICRCTGYRPILDGFKSLAIDACESIRSKLTDIEDLKICTKTGNSCSSNCKTKTHRKTICLSFVDGREWHKAYRLVDVFDIIGNCGDKPYMLVAGNTAHGVYRRSADLKVFIDITSAEELTKYSIGDELEIGANTSLTKVMEIFESAAEQDSGFEYTKELVKHIDLIANIPVRNIGTIAGNLSIKHQHNEFPSDIFLLLATVNAKIVLAERDGTIRSIFPVEWLKVSMKNKVMLKVILPRIDLQKSILRTFKIMPRAQNAHAYVNAGFLFNLNGSIVINARLCFGGIDPKFVCASHTEKLLIGKDLLSQETLNLVVESLNKEINPDWVLPDASPDYRKNLAISLYYKTILNLIPEDKISKELKSGGSLLKRPLSSGTQTFDTNRLRYPVTKPIPRIDGLIQSSGETQYCNDFPVQPNELHGAFVLATKVHGVITGYDTSAALKLDGVVAFFSAKDIPGIKWFYLQNYLIYRANEETFVINKVMFNGQPAGIILAKTFHLANYAAKLVKINYESEKIMEPILTTLAEVLEQKATHRFVEEPLYEKRAIKYGRNTKRIIKGSSTFGSQYHLTMEPQTCVAIPNEDGLIVYSSTQWIHFTQAVISEALNIPMNRIYMETRRLGGGYGAKLTRSIQIAVACSLAAYLLNVPVRLVLPMETNMEAVGKRAATHFEYSVDVDEHGKIQRLTNNYYQDYGCSENEPIVFLTNMYTDSCYNVENWNYYPRGVITNTASNTWCRSPGCMEAAAMIEIIMEHIAKDLGKDPLEIRKLNMTQNNRLLKIIPEYMEKINYNERKKEIDDFNMANRWIKRGISILPYEYQVTYFNTYQIFITIYCHDGTVAISHGGIEMGQGINTKIVQIAAKTLDVPIENVVVKPTNSLIGANSCESGASLTSESVAFGVLKACEQLNERIKPIREEMPDALWKDVTFECYRRDIDLTATYLCKPADFQCYKIHAVTTCEVEVDTLTGNILVKRVDILEDAGESISPLIDVGQVEGAFIMGLGYWLTEVISFDKHGKLLNNRTWNYKPPGPKDIPIDFRIEFMRNEVKDAVNLNSKATGELSLCTSIVVLFALRYALDSARRDANIPDEWFNIVAPYTPDVIFKLAGTDSKQFILTKFP